MDEKRVVGIAYEMDAGAPRVILKGTGKEAEAVLAHADDSVHVVKDAKLVRDLYRVPIDAPIGRELFPVMAALLVHVMRVDIEEGRGRE